MTDNPNPTPAPPENPYKFTMGEDFAAPKRKLPPAELVLIGVAIVVIVAAVLSFQQRQKPQGAGQIDHIAAVEVPNQGMVLAAVTLTLRNTGQKTMWVRGISAKLKTDADEYEVKTPVSGADFDRFFQAFHDLKDQSQPPLMPEAKLTPGEERRGTVILNFPVQLEKFNQRQKLALAIQPYDQALPIVMEK
jgi:hypothetical protein